MNNTSNTAAIVIFTIDNGNGGSDSYIINFYVNEDDD